MKKLQFIWMLLVAFTNSTLLAQVPAPGDPQTAPVMIKAAYVHIGNGTLLENAVVCFDKGIITYVGKEGDAPQAKYKVIEAGSGHVYPGFILPNTNMGLVEIGAVQSTHDYREHGGFKPNVRSLVAFNTDSELLPATRFTGVLSAQVVPEGGWISGTSSIMALDGWNWEDAVIKADDGIHINWPDQYTVSLDTAVMQYRKRHNKKYEDQVKAIATFLEEAKSYYDMEDKPVNMKMQAMEGVFSGEKQVFVHAGYAGDIVAAIRFLEEEGIEHPVLVGAHDAYHITEFLAERDIPVLLDDLHRLPSYEGEDVDMPYKLPFILKEAGLKVGLCYNSYQSARNLPFFAGTAVAYGVDKEEAVSMISGETAQILGVSDQIGTLEKGRYATLFISKGDALDMRTNELTAAFIHGAAVTLEGMQQRLYEKYYQKYSK